MTTAKGQNMSGGYRADVVGSLLRPESLRRARAGFGDGSISAEQLAQAEDDAVRQVIGLQQDCGLPVVTDGEMRRGHYLAPLIEGADGLVPVEGRYTVWRDAQGNPQRLPQRSAIGRKLRLRDRLPVREYQYARTVSGVPVKVTLPSPLALFSRWYPDISAGVYPDLPALFADCAGILSGFIAELTQLGCSYIQFDAPELTAVVDPDARRDLEERGITEAQFLNAGCDLINGLAAAAPDGVRFAVHLCRGNNMGLWRKSGGYERMVSALYERTPDVPVFMLEFDDERSGGFDALQGVPADKLLVLGLVSTKVNRLESAGAIVSRIEEASTYVPVEQLAVSTQCGFSSTAAAATVDESMQRQKLSLVAEVAAQVWG